MYIHKHRLCMWGGGRGLGVYTSIDCACGGGGRGLGVYTP